MKQSTTFVDLWIYFRSASPVYTQSLPADDERLRLVLEDVRMIRHGSHIFVHLRSECEWEHVMHCLQGTAQPTLEKPSSAA